MDIRKKLLLSIGLTLLVTQVVISIWVWHESQEQIQILTDATLSATQKTRMVENELRETLMAFLVPSVILVLVSLAVIYWSINRITKPLVALTTAISQKSGYDLTPIRLEHESIEIATITEKLNLLLSRIASSLDNERRFTSDVAHELRTPLAGMRLNLEMVEEADLPEKHIFIQRIDQLLMTIEQLLNLARAGNRIHSESAVPFDFISEVIEPMLYELEDFPNPIVWEVPAQLMMTGDPSLLYSLLKNLLDNARFYAAHGMQTTVSLVKTPKYIELSVLDNGAGVGEAELQRLTERFSRIDQSRKGFGLGLNIVDRICQVHSAKLEIANRTDGLTGLCIRILFPVL